MVKLAQALGTETISEVLPDSPAALVGLAAIHGGDPVRARSVLGRAMRSNGDVLFERRHALLSGWVNMQDGQLPAAGAEVIANSAAGANRRDALWAAALQTAIARRSGDAGALQKHWYAAVEVLAEYSVDLFALLPLGELWVAAARMRRVDQVRHALDQAFGLLESLGNPALWAVPLHWAGVHAGILANSPESVAPHGQALSGAAGDSALARVLSAAGRTWLTVLANRFDADDVTAAARSLATVGLTSDATRLAGQAALQAPEGRVSGAMLQLARDLIQAGLFRNNAAHSTVHSALLTLRRRLDELEPGLGATFVHASARGYSLVTLGDGAVVRNAAQLAVGSAVTLEFAQGRAGARDEAVTPDDTEERRRHLNACSVF